jgi:hypothetical protein
MDLEISIALGALIVALIAFFISYFAAIISRRSLHHQVLLDIRKDYRSAEMMSAIAELNDFYRDCKEEKDDVDFFKKKYAERIDDDDKKISDSTSNNTMKIEDSLSYKRRLLTHFYSYLAAIHRHGMLPPKMIFDWWIPDDTKMIEKFIIPLEKVYLTKYEVIEKHIDFAMQPLKELKEDCDYYHDDDVNEVKKKLYFYSKRWLDFLKK